MRAVLIVAVALALVAYASAQNCDGSCLTTSECAAASGSTQCRCSLFSCRMITGNCGGGCVSDSQCAEWAQGDESCVCSWGECSNSKDLKYPAYQAFLKQVALQKHKMRAMKAENKA